MAEWATGQLRNHFGDQVKVELWTLNKSLRPEAPAASRGEISETILLVRVSHLTAVAGNTGGKIEVDQLFP